MQTFQELQTIFYLQIIPQMYFCNPEEFFPKAHNGELKRLWHSFFHSVLPAQPCGQKDVQIEENTFQDESGQRTYFITKITFSDLPLSSSYHPVLFFIYEDNFEHLFYYCLRKEAKGLFAVRSTSDMKQFAFSLDNPSESYDTLIQKLHLRCIADEEISSFDSQNIYGSDCGSDNPPSAAILSPCEPNNVPLFLPLAILYQRLDLSSGRAQPLHSVAQMTGLSAAEVHEIETYAYFKQCFASADTLTIIEHLLGIYRSSELSVKEASEKTGFAEEYIYTTAASIRTNCIWLICSLQKQLPVSLARTHFSRPCAHARSKHIREFLT